MMSCWFETAEVEFRVVIVEESLVVPAAKRANWVVSVQPESGVGVIGENAVDSRYSLVATGDRPPNGTVP